MQENVLKEFLDIAELVFSFATNLWDFVSKPLYGILGISLDGIPDWATPITAILQISFAEFVIGGVGFYIAYAIAKWVVGIVTGS